MIGSVRIHVCSAVCSYSADDVITILLLYWCMILKSLLFKMRKRIIQLCTHTINSNRNYICHYLVFRGELFSSWFFKSKFTSRFSEVHELYNLTLIDFLFQVFGCISPVCQYSSQISIIVYLDCHDGEHRPISRWNTTISWFWNTHSIEIYILTGIVVSNGKVWCNGCWVHCAWGN